VKPETGDRRDVIHVYFVHIHIKDWEPGYRMHATNSSFGGREKPGTYRTGLLRPQPPSQASNTDVLRLAASQVKRNGGRRVKVPEKDTVYRPRFPFGTQGSFCPQQPRSACEPSGVQAWRRHACLCAMQGMHYPRAQARVPVPPAGTWRRAAGDANAPEKPIEKEDAGDRGRRADSRVNLTGAASAVQDLLFSRNR
jgi:hypothetical protein